MIVFRGNFNSGIQRVKIALEKLFGLPSAAAIFNRPDIIERSALECMKLMEMYNLDEGNDVRHWIDKIITNLDFTGRYYSPQIILALSTVSKFSELTNWFGVNGVKALERLYKNPEGFINTVRQRMLTEAKNKEPKYKKWFDINGVQVSNMEFKFFMKLLALRFTDQINLENTEDYWSKSTRKLISKTPINFSKKPTLNNKNQYVQIIREVLSGYTGLDFSTK